MPDGAHTGDGPALSSRPWVPVEAEAHVQRVAAGFRARPREETEATLEALIERNRAIHERECVNLNPATNVMNPRAEAALAAGLSTRPSLGYPSAKYETGLEAIEIIEIAAAELAAEVFGAAYAEVRLPSGAIANLAAFMASTRPGDRVIVPPAQIGGHVTHHREGAAGLYGLEIHPAPIDEERYTIDVDALSELARRIRPKLISLGGSCNVAPHPVAEVRAIADDVGAVVLFDAAHLSGLVAGGAWPNPLDQGAHLLTMSTYKSLGGPPAGLLVTNEPELARLVDHIVHPGLTANFDAGKTAALAITLLDWQEWGSAYARQMVETAAALGEQLLAESVPVYTVDGQATRSHQLIVNAREYGGGDVCARHLRHANLLTSAIGLPDDDLAGPAGGLRLGTPEIVRWGMDASHMPALATLIARALRAPDATAAATVAADTSRFRAGFQRLHFIR